MAKKSIVPLILLLMVAVLCCTFPVVSSASSTEGGTQAKQEEPAAAKPAVEDASQAKVNINTANAAELEKLPGIGPKIAEQIVQHRDANGPFKTVEDLKSVKGVGDKKFEAIKAKIAVE
ncbi:ComEA family DNA-binding protein [Desulforhabdus amnigena]|jgi:competence protein ComEA|uniref:Helix-hairpin-helix DNA-binding motif class 1 domain-containing protein n=1 Tax=Desulforhabdus amnigena TaxID=40218 RepID=A0A9W6D6E1_9BACT|nr:helix-hairpin-helix domain-containing protein [Desulforhabdus amnigena]NLJ26948.1 helix-hairpin-helix domain-containing protein [Deltaproteobacteria bacterium]GLI34466.1 hypothetical protein DAMNIGENAA_18990 [Desulforhabdus amnigena]